MIWNFEFIVDETYLVNQHLGQVFYKIKYNGNENI